MEIKFRPWTPLSLGLYITVSRYGDHHLPLTLSTQLAHRQQAFSEMDDDLFSPPPESTGQYANRMS